MFAAHPWTRRRLSKLEYLDVHHNRFEGELAGALFENFHPGCREIFLQDNLFFTDPNGAGGAPSLEDEDEPTRAEKLMEVKLEIEGLFECCTVLC